MAEPLVSVIIPTFNRAHCVDKTIDSVRSTTYRHTEIIVLDDGSTGTIATELPLVLILFYLPPVMAILVATVAPLISGGRSRIELTKIWFNVAKSAASVSAAVLVIDALPRIRGAGPGTWGILFLAMAVAAINAIASDAE